MTEVTHPERLIFLYDLRRDREPRYSRTDMARHFGLADKYSYQTVGHWERGQAIPPEEKHRVTLIDYLWRVLGLRRPDEFEECWQILVEEWGWAPLDEQERRKLKLAPLEAPESASAPLPPSTPVPMQAPTRLPHFVGRQREVGAIAKLLMPATSPAITTTADAPVGPTIVALVGMGGIGKTTLAAHVAHHLRNEFSDGILWGRVATDNPLDILQSWAQAYGYDFSSISSAESRAAAVRTMLAEKQALVVLDDVLTLEAGRLLLPNAAGCAVIITTRNQDIAVALHAQTLTIEELTTQHGIDLLTSLLGAARVEQELEAAHAICEWLHHLPLAVELVAQRLVSRPRQSFAAMVERLEAASYRLDLSISDRAVRTSFLVSWEALTAEQQHIFALLGVFAGRALTVDALASVAEVTQPVVEDTLMDLAALSLVSEEGERYRQHPLLADFAQEQLGEESEPYLRLATYFLTFAQTNQTNYELLDPEWENVMFGMENAHRLQEWQLVLDYAETLTEPWFTRAEYTRARQGYAWAVESAQQLQEEEAEARLLYHWGSACAQQGDYDDANDILNRSLQSAYRLEIGDIIADVQFKSAIINIEQSNYLEAEQLLANCKIIRTDLDDTVGIASVAYWQGVLAFRTGNYKMARNYCLDASHIQFQENDELGLLRTYRLLTDISFERDEFENALHYGQQALNLAQEWHNKGEYAAALYNLSKVYRLLGNLEQAEKCAEDSLKLFQHVGSKLFHALALLELGKISRERNQLDIANSILQRSIAVFRLLKDQFHLVIALYVLGELQIQMLDIQSAKTSWGEALIIADEQEHPGIGKLKERLGTIASEAEF